MIQSWGVRQLVASWVLYWIALVIFAAAPTIWRIWSLRQTSEHGEVTWSWEGGLLPAVLLVLGPPLLVTIVWLATRPKRSTDDGHQDAK